MWIFLNNAMLSIVAHRDHDDALLVRARAAGDIERVFPAADTWEDAQADYRYRAVIPRDQVARAVAESVAGVHYTNFKGSVSEHARHDWYMDVWSAGMRHQLATARRKAVPAVVPKKRSPARGGASVKRRSSGKGQ